jgi:D-galactose 1-dehydrogenase
MVMDRIGIALVGAGKIVRDQHLPAIAADPSYELKGYVSPHSELPDVHAYPDLDALLTDPAVTAVSICTPPQPRHDIALKVLAAGKHAMLEKPPASTVGQIEDVRDVAAKAALSLFATWHSQHAPAVDTARRHLLGKVLHSVKVDWLEDVRRWHPGQAWIWEAGGMGVFDPGINALSILSRILPERLFVQSAELSFPSNQAAPIAVKLALQATSGAPVAATFDWRQQGPQTWDIRVETTDGGLVELSMGGSELKLNGQPQPVGPEREYPEIYARFAELVAGKESEVDIAPLQQVADAYLVGRRLEVEAFVDDTTNA